MTIWTVRAPTSLSLGAIVVHAAVACARHEPPTHSENMNPALQLRIGRDSARPYEGCAYVTRDGTIAHLWLMAEADAPMASLEFGLHVRANRADTIPIWPLYFSTDEPAAWMQDGGGYAWTLVHRTLFFADSGSVTLSTAEPDLLRGTFEVHLSSFGSSLEGSQPESLYVAGRFTAPRDSVMERYVYRSSEDFEVPKPTPTVCRR